MKKHKKYIVWAKSQVSDKKWYIVVESNNWDEVAQAYKNELFNQAIGEVIITEFVPLDISIGRKTVSLAPNEITPSKIGMGIEGMGITIDKSTGIIYIDGKEVELLTNLEYRLLSLFYEREDEIVDRANICSSIWNEDYTTQDDARIEKLISRLRRRIEPDPKNPRYLVSVRGRGYRLYKSGDQLT